MIDFAILALPRSGTTWAANWLTTEHSLCLHDPMADISPSGLQAFGGQDDGRLHGVSCTALWMQPDWVVANVKRWLILERSIDEVNCSLRAIGLGDMPEESVQAFRSMSGPRAPMSDLFRVGTARVIWEYLVPGLPFDVQRHALLKTWMVNPFFAGWEPDPVAVKAWMQRAQEAMQ